ncbi:MAG: hypothetical protein R2875_11870 [Desulfobacterales bacterium]
MNPDKPEKVKSELKFEVSWEVMVYAFLVLANFDIKNDRVSRSPQGTLDHLTPALFEFLKRLPKTQKI